MHSNQPIEQLDDAIGEFVKANSDGAEFVTGWVLSVSVKNASLPRSDGYLSHHSEGLPYHSQVGLLRVALEEMQNTVLINTWKLETER